MPVKFVFGDSSAPWDKSSLAEQQKQSVIVLAFGPGITMTSKRNFVAHSIRVYYEPMVKLSI